MAAGEKSSPVTRAPASAQARVSSPKWHCRWTRSRPDDVSQRRDLPLPAARAGRPTTARRHRSGRPRGWGPARPSCRGWRPASPRWDRRGDPRERPDPRSALDSALDDVAEQVHLDPFVLSQATARSTTAPSPSSSQMIQPSCSPTSARRMLGTTSSSLTMRAMTGSRTSSSGKVSLTRTPITAWPRRRSGRPARR